MSEIRRDTFLRGAEGHAILLADLEDDPRTAGTGLERADVDGNGEIAGERELAALFGLLDGLDGRRNGRLDLVTRGRATPLAPVAEGLAERAGVGALRPPNGTATVREAVLVLGMSETSVAEAAALRRNTPVLLVTDVASGREVARAGDRVFDLASSSGRRAFVETLALPARVREDVLRVLANARDKGRRELAELARTWAPAERGQPIPARLMVSGHGDGRSFFGNDHDELRDADLVAMARAMPRAAERVEHLHLAACQHGYLPRMRAFLDVMPNLQSIWGYTGFSPSGGPAELHQGTWEAMTRSLPRGGTTVSRDAARGTHRGQAVAVWTAARGWEGLPIRELRFIHDDVEASERDFDEYFDGELEVNDPMQGPLAARYQLLQEQMNHIDFAEQSDRYQRRCIERLDQTLRLRFFGTHVTRAFDAHYRGAIVAGYAAIGLEPPSFAGMTRRRALEEVARFEDAVARHGGEQAPHAARELRALLVEGLRDLDPSRIPVRWL